MSPPYACHQSIPSLPSPPFSLATLIGQGPLADTQGSLPTLPLMHNIVARHEYNAESTNKLLFSVTDAQESDSNEYEEGMEYDGIDL
jgi:hypothetical protein